MSETTNDASQQQIGNYKIVRHIASGGMAAVHLAMDVSLQRQVALKVMLPSLARDADFVSRFQREARAAARLEHPNIVRIYETGLTPAQEPYIAMQYIDGDSLQEALAQLAQQDKVYPTMQALWIAKQVAEALDTAHKAGIVHRDLKPSNILLRRDGTPVLTDLGIATVQGETRLTHTGSIIGTPHYMSPEQVLGKTVDGRSDIYSLGVVLYELLAGKVPFDADSAVAILHQQAYETPPPLNSLRPGLSSQTQLIVNSCLQKDPQQRYPTAAHLVVALETAIAAESSERRVAPLAGAYAATQLDVAPPDVPVVEEEEKRNYLWLLLLLIPLFLIGILFFLWQNANAERQALVMSMTVEAMAADVVSQTQEADAVAVVVEETVDSGSLVQEAGTIVPEEMATAVPSPTPLPSNTPVPTATPLPTNTPIPTATFTPAPTPCGINVSGQFSGNYSAQLGCATAGVTTGVWMAQESFEHGRMIWRSDNDKIYAIFNNGTWAAYDDIWVEGDPTYACGSEQTPPTPQRGFGKIWCTYNNVRNGLGNATNAEAGINGSIQQFESGFMIRPDGSSVRALNYDGTWR